MELTDGSFVTSADYLEKAKEKHENTVYYTTDKAAQAQYISMFEAQEIQVAVFEKQLDTQFLSVIESYTAGIKYVRIDADIAGALKSDDAVAEDKTISELFKSISENDQLKVEFAALKDTSVPVLLTISEESRRMEEMMKLYAMNGMSFGMDMPRDETLTVNTSCPLIAKLGVMEEEKQKKTATYLYRLAQLSQRKLNAEELQKFLNNSYSMLEML